MTILYDWKKIKSISRGKVSNIFTILKYLTFKEHPKTSKHRLSNFYGKDYSGTSYLLYPEKLLEYSHCYTLREIAEYVALASYRNYSEYLMSGDCTLKLTHSPVSQLNNRLLRIEDGRIHFLFEEVMEKK
jgi:hypothetical protein